MANMANSIKKSQITQNTRRYDTYQAENYYCRTICLAGNAPCQAAFVTPSIKLNLLPFTVLTPNIGYNPKEGSLCATLPVTSSYSVL
jgi:hypothetical protein